MCSWLAWLTIGSRFFICHILSLLHEILTVHFLHAALTAVIQTQQTVLAAVGEDAELSCQLLETKDILQVAWQKSSNDVETNVATYNKYFGQRVNDGFTDKEDHFYHCLFNTYPEGSFTGKPCHQVVSCSATGRPAPTVTLSVSQQDLNFSQYNTVSVSNTNATFTVTTTAVLSGSRNNSTQVECAARVLSAPQRETMVMILEVQHVHGGNDDNDDGKMVKEGTFFKVIIYIRVCHYSVILMSKILDFKLSLIFPDFFQVFYVTFPFVFFQILLGSLCWVQ
uniref:Ig-like domain-containing protein n=1 Tax=Maylandia zebra TaxID=106582 RepID=A0A3P9CPJ6_9CICH